LENLELEIVELILRIGADWDDKSVTVLWRNRTDELADDRDWSLRAKR